MLLRIEVKTHVCVGKKERNNTSTDQRAELHTARLEKGESVRKRRTMQTFLQPLFRAEPHSYYSFWGVI